MKYIDADLLRKEIEKNKNMIDGLFTEGDDSVYDGENDAYNRVLHIIDSLQQEQDMGEVSDGYHTFNELYYYRMLYNAAFFNFLPKSWVHKSKRHYTGEECFGGGWFIVMANLPTGQVSNHYELKDWDLFKVPEKELADEWDGHTPQEAAERLHKYLQQEQPDTDGLYLELADFLTKNDVPEEKAKFLANRILDLYGSKKYLEGLCDGIKQEQPEVDFKIEERKWIHNAVDNVFPEDGDFMSEVDFRKILKDTARHFYSLRLNARKE